MTVPGLNTLTTDKLARIKSLADQGDLMAQAAYDSILNESALASVGAGLVAGGHPATASATAVHAATIFGDAVGPATVTTGITNPDVPRNLLLTFGATWDGGDVTVHGTDQYNAPTSELFVTNAGGTRTGSKMFKTVTSVTYAGGGVGTHGTNTVEVGTGVKIGITVIPHTASPVLLFVDGVGEAVTFDATNNSFAPTTAPNGSHVYVLTFNL